MTAVARPSAAARAARWTASVVLPAPPFWLMSATIFMLLPQVTLALYPSVHSSQCLNNVTSACRQDGVASYKHSDKRSRGYVGTRVCGHACLTTSGHIRQ